MAYQESYKKLLTYQQGMQIYQKTKLFTAGYLHKYRDLRLIGHMNDSAQSVPSNIREGAKRRNTKAYIEFLGYSRASLEELKGDFEELERELKAGLRWKDKDEKGKTRIEKDIKGLLKLIYGEDCMLGRQIKSLEEKFVKQGDQLKEKRKGYLKKQFFRGWIRKISE